MGPVAVLHFVSSPVDHTNSPAGHRLPPSVPPWWLKYHRFLPLKVGATPLHVAAAQGLAPFVKELLVHGAQHDATDGQGNLPLHLAAEQVGRLVQHCGVGQDQPTDGVRNPLPNARAILNSRRATINRFELPLLPVTHLPATAHAGFLGQCHGAANRTRTQSRG